MRQIRLSNALRMTSKLMIKLILEYKGTDFMNGSLITVIYWRGILKHTV